MYAISIMVGIALGLLLLVQWKNIFIKRILRAAKANAVLVALLIAAPLLVMLENFIRGPDATSKELVYTNWIFTVSGDAILLLQDRLDYRIIADVFILVYVWVFTYILYFTPILILAKEDTPTLRRYAIAILLNYLVLMPFYIFFPVTVTGFYSDSGMTPLLYIDTNWGRMVTGVDPLDNDFPSGHVSLVVTTMLVIGAAGTDYRRYTYFLVGSAIAVVFAVLYLGVHWLADVLAGLALAIAATTASGNVRVQVAVQRLANWFSRKSPGEQTNSR